MSLPPHAVVLVPFDQLSRAHGALRWAVPGTHEVLMVESERMLRSRTWHAQRLHLVLSAAAHTAADLRAEGFTVHYREAPTVSEGVRAFAASHAGRPVCATEPTSRQLQHALLEAGVHLLDDDHFLTPRSAFADWAAGRTSLLMEDFYRWQRKRLRLMVEDGQPWGGRWNFDADNRLPPPKGEHPWPEPLTFESDDIDRQTWERIRAMDVAVTGTLPNGTWATTRSGALAQLEHFTGECLAGFGPYEDAMPAASWAGYHSLLSTYLNLGLLSPREVIQAALDRYRDGGVPMASLEGFVRQVAGWREYVNGMYWTMDDDYRQRNELNVTAGLPPALEGSSTSMACVGAVVADVHERGWTHHIPRLMVLANLTLLAGVRPDRMLAWMRRMFVDAAEWVMVPNVIGMGLHADGGQMMTKPYAAGGAYISRMGQYCKGCAFDPKARTGPTACPFTTLYWDFLDRNRAAFTGNHRMAQQIAGLDRLTDLELVRARAREVREELEAGTL